MNKKTAKMTLEEKLLMWREFMDELEIPFYINQSCALGIYREGHLFSNERVVEFGVLESDITDNKLYTLEKEKDKYDFHYENPHIAPYGLLYFHDLELQVVCFKNNKAFYNLLYNAGIWFPQEYLLRENWGKINYLGMEWNVPGNIEKYFTCTYGDWTIPRSFVWVNEALNRTTWEEL